MTLTPPFITVSFCSIAPPFCSKKWNLSLMERALPYPVVHFRQAHHHSFTACLSQIVILRRMLTSCELQTYRPPPTLPLFPYYCLCNNNYSWPCVLPNDVILLPYCNCWYWYWCCCRCCLLYIQTIGYDPADHANMIVAIILKRKRKTLVHAPVQSKKQTLAEISEAGLISDKRDHEHQVWYGTMLIMLYL